MATTRWCIAARARDQGRAGLRCRARRAEVTAAGSVATACGGDAHRRSMRSPPPGAPARRSGCRPRAGKPQPWAARRTVVGPLVLGQLEHLLAHAHDAASNISRSASTRASRVSANGVAVILLLAAQGLDLFRQRARGLLGASHHLRAHPIGVAVGEGQHLADLEQAVLERRAPRISPDGLLQPGCPLPFRVPVRMWLLDPIVRAWMDRLARQYRRRSGPRNRLPTRMWLRASSWHCMATSPMKIESPAR